MSTSHASPNDFFIVIIIIIIVIGKLDADVHRVADYSTELFIYMEESWFYKKTNCA
ncbi:MAG: hypothetical protein ACK40V_03340 [Anaerolineales bacterium]